MHARHHNCEDREQIWLSLPRARRGGRILEENSTLTERGLVPPLEPNRIDLGQVDAQGQNVDVVVDLPNTRYGAEGPLEFGVEACVW